MTITEQFIKQNQLAVSNKRFEPEIIDFSFLLYAPALSFPSV